MAAPSVETVRLAARLRASGLSSYDAAAVLGVVQRTVVNYWQRADGPAEPLTLAEWAKVVRDRPCGGVFVEPPTLTPTDPEAVAAQAVCAGCPLTSVRRRGRLTGPCSRVGARAPDRPRRVVLGGRMFGVHR